MTNKRKKLVRAVADRSGVSYEGALNILRKPRVDEKSIFDRFAFDQINAQGPSEWSNGVFHRTALIPHMSGFLREMKEAEGWTFAPLLPVSVMYDKADTTAFIFSEDDDFVLAVERPRRVIVTPQRFYIDSRVPRDAAYFEKILRDRITRKMAALILNAAVSTSGDKTVLSKDVEPTLREHFGTPNFTLQKSSMPGLMIGMLDPVGVRFTVDQYPSGPIQNGDEVYGYRMYVGLVVFSNRVKGVRVAP